MQGRLRRWEMEGNQKICPWWVYGNFLEIHKNNGDSRMLSLHEGLPLLRLYLVHAKFLTFICTSVYTVFESGATYDMRKSLPQTIS